MSGGRGARPAAWIVALAGLGLSLVAWWTDPSRLPWSWLVAYAIVVLASLGCLGLRIITQASGGEWFAPFRPLAARGASALPVLVLLFVPVVAWSGALYPWAHLATVTPAEQVILTRAGWWRSTPAFALRAALCLGSWTVLAAVYQRRRQVTDRFTIGALVLWVLTLTMAALDWMMGTAAPWRSTIYPVSVFATAMIAGLALLAALVPWADRRGLLPGLTASHLDALGRLLLTFVLFRAYTGYSQLNIIWSADLPAEATWYLARIRGPWRVVGIVMLAGHALAFLALLVRRVRRDAVMLARIGAWLLTMHVIDLYWLLMPDGSAARATPAWPDLAALMAVAGLATAVASRSAARQPPPGDTLTGAANAS